MLNRAIPNALRLLLALETAFAMATMTARAVVAYDGADARANACADAPTSTDARAHADTGASADADTCAQNYAGAGADGDANVWH
jgi:hypothetical protein